jgi:hypothetical protein
MHACTSELFPDLHSQSDHLQKWALCFLFLFVHLFLWIEHDSVCRILIIKCNICSSNLRNVRFLLHLRLCPSFCPWCASRHPTPGAIRTWSIPLALPWGDCARSIWEASPEWRCSFRSPQTNAPTLALVHCNSPETIFKCVHPQVTRSIKLIISCYDPNPCCRNYSAIENSI